MVSTCDVDGEDCKPRQIMYARPEEPKEGQETYVGDSKEKMGWGYLNRGRNIAGIGETGGDGLSRSRR
jgi:hypothetical protein